MSIGEKDRSRAAPQTVQTSAGDKTAAGPGANARVAFSLAQHLVGLNRDVLTESTRQAALRCILDTLASAAAALDDPGVLSAGRVVSTAFGNGDVPIWFSGTRASAGAATFANSVAAAALDLDDGYRRARGHPGAAVIPAALAAFRRAEDADADEFLLAVVAGYEAGLRMSMARPSYAPSGAWAPYAAIASAGRLKGANAQQIAHAFAIAAQTAPALPALAGLAGSDVKEGIPFGCSAGLLALELAMKGSVGPVAILDDEKLFKREAILPEIAGTPLIEGVYFKPFGCCRHIHGALDAFLNLKSQHNFSVHDIVRIEVHTYLATFNLANKPEPESLVEAQYSVPYCLAVCALHGAEALLPLRSECLRDPLVRALARLVHVLHDPDIEPLFPARSPSWVRIEFQDGRQVRSPLTDPRGDPTSPLTWGELVNKLAIATERTISDLHRRQIVNALESLRNGDIEPLLSAIETRGLLQR